MIRALARREADAVSLAELLTDAPLRDQALDHPALVEALLSQVGHVATSPPFYFYVLTRHALRADGIDDRPLCDYIASMLEHFSRAERGGGPGQIYLCDLLGALREASPAQAFLLRAHVGNSALFLTGIFPESVERRSRRGAPDCSYYEAVGRASYRALVDHQTAHKWGLSEVFDGLAAQFHGVRVALNGLAERLLHLDGSGALPIVG